MAEEFDELDGMPEDMGDAAEIDDTDASADDGVVIGFDGSDVVDPEQADEPEQNAVEKEKPEDGEPEQAPGRPKWDKVRQQKDQEIASLRKKVEELEGTTDTEPETETPEAEGGDFDTLFDRVEAAETKPEKSPVGETPDDLEYDELIADNKKLRADLETQSSRLDRIENISALEKVYKATIESHKLDPEQTAALHKSVQTEFRKRGYTQAKQPGAGEFGDIVELAAIKMELTAAKQQPTTRRKKASPATPRPSTGPGASARTPGSSANYATTKEAFAAADARRAAKQ